MPPTQNPSVKRPLLFAFMLIHLGTTYVIKEGGIEVGRWMENDGKDRIEEIHQDKPKSSAKPAGVTQAPPAKVKYDWIYDREGYASVLRKQKEKKIPVFLYFYATWCPVCAKFDEEIFANAKVRNHLAAFPKVRIDSDHEPDLTSKYGVTGFPTFFVLHPSGARKEVARYSEPDHFIDELKQAGL